MTSARDIRPRADDFAAQAQYLSTSPNASFHSPSSHSSVLTRTVPIVNAKHLKPFATEDIKVLLLENVNQAGRDILKQQGYQVEFLKSSLPEDQLIEKIR
jgi:D-3-phosphoglycerate dehydrogenase